MIVSWKKVLKILIFGIQSKLVNRNTILLEVTNSDILKEDIKILLNLLKFTKTLHYFNIITRDKVTEEVEAAPEEEQVLINGTETEEDAEVVEDKVETEAETTEEVKEDQPEEQTEEEQPVELVEAVTELTEAVEEIAEVLSEDAEEEQKEGEANV